MGKLNVYCMFVNINRAEGSAGSIAHIANGGLLHCHMAHNISTTVACSFGQQMFNYSFSKCSRFNCSISVSSVGAALLSYKPHIHCLLCYPTLIIIIVDISTVIIFCFRGFIGDAHSTGYFLGLLLLSYHEP